MYVCVRARVRACVCVCVSPENLCNIGGFVLREPSGGYAPMCQVLYMDPCYLCECIPPTINAICVDHTLFSATITASFTGQPAGRL